MKGIGIKIEMKKKMKQIKKIKYKNIFNKKEKQPIKKKRRRKKQEKGKGGSKGKKGMSTRKRLIPMIFKDTPPYVSSNLVSDMLENSTLLSYIYCTLSIQCHQYPLLQYHNSGRHYPALNW